MIKGGWGEDQSKCFLLLGSHRKVTRLPVAAWVIDSEVAGVIDRPLQAVREGEVGDVCVRVDARR